MRFDFHALIAMACRLRKAKEQRDPRYLAFLQKMNRRTGVPVRILEIRITKLSLGRGI